MGSEDAGFARRWLMLPVALSATFMYGFDFNVVNVALPSLQHDLDAGPVALELVVGGYAFSYAAGLVTGGRLGDLFSYRRMFLAGMAAFTLVSVLCGVAQTPGELVAARCLQGLAAAAMVPQVLALITSTFPAEERTRALAWFGATAAISGVLGQVLGGLLLDADLLGLSWRVIFLLNLPVGLLVLVLAYRLLPPASSGRRPPLDLIGVAGISGGLALALIPLILGRSEHWPVWAWVMLAAAVPVTAGALRYEQRLGRRGGNPLVDLTLFRIRTFSAGLATAVAFMAFFTSSIFVLSLFLQTGLGLSPLRGGLSFAPFALLAMVTALTGPKLIARHGAPTVIRAGCLISATGTVLVELYLTTAGGSVAVGWLVAELGLIGAGNSLILTAYLGAALSAVKREQAGIASGTLNTIQQFAGTGGLAIIGAIFFSCLGTHPGRDQYAHATGIALWIGLGLIAAIALLTRSLTSRPPSDQSTTSATRSAVSVSTAVDGQVGG